MSKTKEQLLLDYKKSNKTRREKILKKAGFSSEATYLAYLMEPDTTTAGELSVSDDGLLDQVIAFDTTGSMSGYIAAVREHVKDLIPRLFAENKNLKIKIVAFGDYCDMTSNGKFGNAYQETDLTDDENVLINFVEHAKNTGGGDADEFYELVLQKILDETPWRKNARKAILLIGDCSPHPVGYYYHNVCQNNQIDWREEARKAATMGVQIDTLSCGTLAVQTFYKPLSEMTNGVNIPFKSSHKTQEAIYATTSVRGSKLSKISFEASYTDALRSGDDELIGTYKSLSRKL